MNKSMTETKISDISSNLMNPIHSSNPEKIKKDDSSSVFALYVFGKRAEQTQMYANHVNVNGDGI